MNYTKPLLAAALVVLVFMDAGSAGAIECLRPALQEGLDALHPGVSVDVSMVTVASWDNSTPAPDDDNMYYVFRPRTAVTQTGFIILPGGNCDPRSYAPAAHAIAEKGFLTFIIPMPACVAILGYTRSDKIIQDYAQIEKWVIGGHSIGGTSAGIYALQNTTVSGVVIWASLPDPANRLDATTIKVLSIYGSEDGRVPPEKVSEYAQYLPADTVYVEIEGANHTQFGWIDPAPYACLEGDMSATITIEQQQDEIVQATTVFLKQFNENTCPVIDLFGSKDPRTRIISRFRDEILARSAAGRSIIASYAKNGAHVIEMLKKHPFIKSSAARVLEALLPVLELLL